MAEDRWDDVLRALGRLEEGQENAREGRRVIHEKLEDFTSSLQETNKTLARTNFVLEVTTGIATQTRDNLEAFKRKFDEEAAPVLAGVSSFQEEAQPIIDQIRKARAAILVLIALLSLFGVSAVGTLLLFNDYAKAIVREWLDLEPPNGGIPPIN